MHMHQVLFRLRLRHIFIFGPLLLFGIVLLCFLCFRLDWVRQVDIPASYDFKSALAPVMDPSSEEIIFFNELCAKIEKLEQAVYKDDAMGYFSGLNLRVYSYADCNMYKRVEALNSDVPRVLASMPAYVARFDEIDALIQQAVSMNVSSRLMDEIDGFNFVFSYMDLLKMSYVFHVKKGDLETAAKRMASLSRLIGINCHIHDGIYGSPDALFEELLLVDMLAAQVTNYAGQERLLTLEMLEAYEELRPRYTQLVQRWYVSVARVLASHIDELLNQQEGMARFAAGYYVQEPLANRYLRSFVYLLLDDATHAEALATYHNTDGLIHYQAWKVVLHKETSSMFIVNSYADSIIYKEQYENEAKKQRWLWRAAAVYAAIWRYKLAHQALPEHIRMLNLMDAEIDGIYYQKISATEFYVKSVEALDAGDPAQLDTLLREHAYWYYKEVQE